MKHDEKYGRVKQVETVGDPPHKLQNPRVEEASKVTVVDRHANHREAAGCTYATCKKPRQMEQGPKITREKKSRER